MDPITQFDFSILHFIHDNISCGFMDFLMPKVTWLTEMGAVWLLAAALFLIFRRYRASVAIAGGILASLLFGNLLLKHIVARARPCWLEPTFQMLIAVPHDYSFPSAHSMVSFAAAVAIFHYNKKAGIPALVIAALIAFSRLYLFVHFPSDVLASVALGLAITAGVSRLFRRIPERSAL